MITVHHLEQSRSHRILWLLEELGVEYEVKNYKRDKKTKLAPPELKAVHPLGKSPVITDDGRVVAETGAIIEYLIDKYDSNNALRPAADTQEFQQYRYWLHAGEGSVMALLVLRLVLDAMTKPPVPFFLRPITKVIVGEVGKAYLNPTLTANVEQMEATLAKSAWFAGDALSGADILMSFPAEAIIARAAKSGELPNLRRFLEAVHARPAYQRAIEQGGPLEILG